MQALAALELRQPDAPQFRVTHLAQECGQRAQVVHGNIVGNVNGIGTQQVLQQRAAESGGKAHRMAGVLDRLRNAVQPAA